MAKGKTSADSGKIELSVILHDTAAAIRMGGDGYFITFAGTEADIDKAVSLVALKKMRLKLTVEVDDGEGKDNQGEVETKSSSGQRDWISKRRA